MVRTQCLIALGVMALCTTRGIAADEKYSIKSTDNAPPKELKEPFRKLLPSQSIQLFDDKGKPLVEVWFRKELPVKATEQQVKAGLTYRELEETTFLGVIRFEQQSSDYRKQRLKPGVYTLRLGMQPMDGDHMGTSPYPEFCLLIPADRDESPAVMSEPKQLHDRSTRSTGTSHPGILLLFPSAKPTDQPELANKGMGHWVLFVKANAVNGGQKVPLGIGLTLVGHATE